MDFKLYKQKNISVDKLDQLMNWVMSGSGTKFGAIVSGFKIIVCFAYFYTRNKIIDIEMEIDKQQTEQDISNEHDQDNNIVGV